MNKTLLVSITLFILIIGIGCASAADLSHAKTNLKDSKAMVSKVDSTKNVKSLSTKKAATKKVSKKAAVKKVSSKKTVKPVDKVIRGWNPKDHEVSRKSLGGGLTRITYDDGYFRIVDSSGNILSYGF